MEDIPPFVAGSTTSFQAAIAMKPCAETCRQQVIEALRAAGLKGLTDEEGIAATGMNPSTYRPRRIELAEAGKIVQLGEKRRTASNHPAVVWFHADAAKSPATA